MIFLLFRFDLNWCFHLFSIHSQAELVVQQSVWLFLFIKHWLWRSLRLPTFSDSRKSWIDYPWTSLELFLLFHHFLFLCKFHLQLFCVLQEITTERNCWSDFSSVIARLTATNIHLQLFTDWKNDSSNFWTIWQMRTEIYSESSSL